MTIFNMAYLKSSWWWGWWQPWANTLVYYNINDNDTNSYIYDLSWNNHTQTWSWTAAYTTDATYGRVAVFNGNSDTYTSAWSIVDFWSECTFIALFYRKNVSSSSAIVTECASSSSYPIWIACEVANKYQWWYAWAGNWNAHIQSTSDAVANQWVMIATTRASDGTAKIYINWTLDNTVSWMATPNYTSWNNLRIWNWRGTYYPINWKFKLFIGENRTWSDAEIAALAQEYGFTVS